MTIDEIKTVCYVGAGTMGCANSLVAAVSGYDVVIYDVSKDSLAQVADKHEEMGAFLVASGYCSVEELVASAARISCEQDLKVAVEDADLVSESVVEDFVGDQNFARSPINPTIEDCIRYDGSMFAKGVQSEDSIADTGTGCLGNY